MQRSASHRTLDWRNPDCGLRGLTRSLGAFGLSLLACMIVRSLADDTIVRENALLFWSLAGMALAVGTRRIGNPGP